MWGKPLVGLTLLCLPSLALQSTGRRTPKRFKPTRSSCFTGEKTRHPYHLPHNRSGNEWLAGEAKRAALLKAPVGVDPNQPPTTGWKFYIYKDRKYEEDVSLICSSQPESPCCSITVSLSGAAKEERSWCGGEYKSNGLISMGRQVIYQCMSTILS